MEDRDLKEHKVTKLRSPKLITAICDSVNDVSGHCLAQGLITEETNDKMLCSGNLSKDKARILLSAVRCAVEIKSDCFETFVDILNETLPRATKKTVIAYLKDIKASTSSDGHRRRTSRRRSKPKSATGNHHPRFNLVDLPFVRFTGPLATKNFQKIDRDFCEALSACNTTYVMSETKKILSMNVSMDYKCISLVHRAKCKAHCKGQRDEALLDCDRAIKLASNLECENGSLIIGRALTMKASILRWSERSDEALGCVDRAKSQFSW